MQLKWRTPHIANLVYRLLPLSLSTSLSCSLFARLRTLSSGRGAKTPSGGGPTGAKSGGTADHSPLKHSQSHNSFISPPKQLPTPTASSGKKFPLATHRYGKEELLQLFSDVERPEDIPHLLPLTKTRLATPLSFMPLSEEEQVGLWGT